MCRVHRGRSLTLAMCLPPRHWCTQLQAALANLHHGGAAGVDVGDQHHVPRGVPQPVIEALPQVRYAAMPMAPTQSGSGAHVGVAGANQAGAPASDAHTRRVAVGVGAPAAGGMKRAGPAPRPSGAAPRASLVTGSPTAAAPGAGASVGDDPLSQTTCAICLCEFEVGEMLTELPCRHRYHPACISQWLHINKVSTTHPTGPSCRSHRGVCS